MVCAEEVANKQCEWERRIGGGSLITSGTRTKALVTSYRESIGRKAA